MSTVSELVEAAAKKYGTETKDRIDENYVKIEREMAKASFSQSSSGANSSAAASLKSLNPLRQ